MKRKKRNAEKEEIKKLPKSPGADNFSLTENYKFSEPKKSLKDFSGFKSRESSNANLKMKAEAEKAVSVQEKQLKYVVITMIAIVVVALVVYYWVQESKRFEYGGIKFEEIDSNKIKMYQGKIPIKDAGGNLVANYNIFLRNDPRELDDIAVNGSIRFMPNVVASLAPEAERDCSDNGIAGANFFGFLKSAGLKTLLAYNNQRYAEERNASYAVCRQNVGYTLVSIVKGSENKITQNSQDCYTLEFKDCDILKVVERFIVASYAQSKGISV